MEDTVVTDSELHCKEQRHRTENVHITCFISVLYLALALIKLIKLCLRDQAYSIKLVDLLSDDSILEEKRLLEELVSDLVDGDYFSRGSSCFAFLLCWCTSGGLELDFLLDLSHNGADSVGMKSLQALLLGTDVEPRGRFLRQMVTFLVS